MTGQDVVVGMVALIGVAVLVRKLTGAVRTSSSSTSAGCPTCASEDAHCAPAPTTSKTR